MGSLSHSLFPGPPPRQPVIYLTYSRCLCPIVSQFVTLPGSLSRERVASLFLQVQSVHCPIVSCCFDCLRSHPTARFHALSRELVTSLVNTFSSCHWLVSLLVCFHAHCPESLLLPWFTLSVAANGPGASTHQLLKRRVK